VTAGYPAVVVDTNFFAAELTRHGAAVADAYRDHVEGRDLFIPGAGRSVVEVARQVGRTH